MTDEAPRDPLDRVFDTVVCGTSLPSSLLAAGLARTHAHVLDASGASVRSILHVDANDYYGEQHASFTLHQLAALIAEKHALSSGPLDIGGIRIHAHTRAVPPQLAPHARKVILDIIPLLTISRGEAVDVLVSSGVASYAEFKSLEALGCTRADGAHVVHDKIPCRKSDIFLHPSMSLSDKRRLMNFLGHAFDVTMQTRAQMDAMTLNNRTLAQGRSLLRPQNKAAASSASMDASRPFDEHLGSFDLSPDQRKMITYAVAHVPNRASGASPVAALSTGNGMRLLMRTIHGMNRFGSTPFIVPVYGCGEIAQALTRVCAVHGGVYMLATAPGRLESLAAGPAETATGDAHDEQLPQARWRLPLGARSVRCANVICSPQYAAQMLGGHVTYTHIVVSAVCVTATGVRINGDPATPQLVHCTAPPGTFADLPSSSCFIFQQGEANATSRAGWYVLNVWTCVRVDEVQPGTNHVVEGSPECIAIRATAAARLEACLSRIVLLNSASSDAADPRPSCVWHCIATAPTHATPSVAIPDGVFLIDWSAGSTLPVDTEDSVHEAVRIFNVLRPGMEFMHTIRDQADGDRAAAEPSAAITGPAAAETSDVVAPSENASDTGNEAAQPPVAPAPLDVDAALAILDAEF